MDGRGRAGIHDDPLGRTTSWERDLLGRTVTTVLPDIDGVGGNPAPELHTSYDILSRVLTETDALGNVVQFEWDNLSRLVERTDSDPDGAGGPLAAPVTTYTRDLVGNLTSLTDSVGNTTSWVRDNLHRVTSETNELNDARTWVFDSMSNIVSQTDRNGRTIERDFDGLNRLLEERWLDGQTIVNTLNFGWDIASQLGTADDDFSGYAFTHDGLGRTTQTDNSPTPDMPNVVLTHGWDANSQRTSLSATINGTADFANTYQFDPLGRMTRIQQTDGAAGSGYAVSDKRVDIAYTQAGELDTISRYADLAATDLVATSTYGRDDAGRLTSLVHAKGATTLASYGWQFDDEGRMTSATSNDGTTTFTYDTNHQLTDADHSYQTDEAYEFDLNGNRTSAGAATYTVGTNNQISSDGTHSYLYDEEGNRTRKTTIATGAYVDYQWDHRNRLTAVTFKTSAGVTTKKVEYAYDLFNRLIARRLDSNGDSTFDSVLRFVYDQAPDKGGLSDTVLVFDDSGSLEHRFLPGPAVDQVFADEDALGEVLWGLTDHQNTVRDVVDYNVGTDTTSVVNHLRYDSFGAITAQTNSALQPLLAWTGRFRDDVTGLQWNLNRWYDPSLGRWLSEDPIVFRGGDENLARYVGISPTNAVDPSGLAGDWLDKALEIGVGGSRGVLNSFSFGLFAKFQDSMAPPTTRYNPTAERVTETATDILQGAKGGLKSVGDDAFELGAKKKTQAELRKEAAEALSKRKRAPRTANPNPPRPVIQNRLPDRVNQALPEGHIRTPQELEQARNFYKRNIDESRQWYEQRTGKQWPVDPATGKPQWAEHPRALKNGGDPLYIEPGVGPDPNARHMIPGPDGLTDQQRWGRMGGRPKTNR